MELLALKLTLTPILIAIASLAGRRWGPVVSGWFVGLPLTSAPVTLYLALERGPAFAADAACGTLAGLISVAAFCLVYGWCAQRHHSWQACVTVGLVAFWALTMLWYWISLPAITTFVAVTGFLSLALFLMPVGSGAATERISPRWDLPVRVLTATAFVLLLTGFAETLGPRLSGLVAPLPIFAGILAAFTHQQEGAVPASALARGVILGNYAFAAFFLVLALQLVSGDIPAAFFWATLAAFVVQAAVVCLLSHAR